MQAAPYSSLDIHPELRQSTTFGNEQITEWYALQDGNFVGPFKTEEQAAQFLENPTIAVQSGPSALEHTMIFAVYMVVFYALFLAVTR